MLVKHSSVTLALIFFPQFYLFNLTRHSQSYDDLIFSNFSELEFCLVSASFCQCITKKVQQTELRSCKIRKIQTMYYYHVTWSVFSSVGLTWIFFTWALLIEVEVKIEFIVQFNIYAHKSTLIYFLLLSSQVRTVFLCKLTFMFISVPFFSYSYYQVTSAHLYNLMTFI